MKFTFQILPFEVSKLYRCLANKNSMPATIVNEESQIPKQFQWINRHRLHPKINFSKATGEKPFFPSERSKMDFEVAKGLRLIGFVGVTRLEE